MKWQLIFLLLFPFFGLSQINFQLGQAVTLGNKNAAYEVIYKNHISSYHSNFRKVGTETFLKVSSYNPWETAKFSVRYTLEFGLKYFNYYGTSFHIPTGGYLEDAPVGVGTSNFYLRAISWTNGADFIYRINNKYTFINRLGLKIEVVNGGREDKLKGGGRSLLTPNNSNEKVTFSNPMISITVSPQLLIHLRGFSLGIHLNQDLLLVNNVVNAIKKRDSDLGKVELSTFTSLGISIMPNFYLIDSKKPLNF